jgi:hypothetical protein
MWDLNQACTQMARANYCMDGKPHTREKTPVLIRDFIPPAEPPNSGPTALTLVPPSYPPVPPPPDRFFYEAAWAPRKMVLCLDRLRWNDFGIHELCDGALPDPRTDDNGAAFCEDAHFDFNDRNILNGSKTMDLALHRWGNGSGDQLTTVHGYIVDASKGTSVPPAGFNAPALSNEGYLLRNLTGEFATCGCVVQAYRLRNASTGDSVLGPDGMLPGYTHNWTTDVEGWLITTAADDRAALYLYQRGTDYVTATKLPDFGLTGFKKVGGPSAPPIGYVIAASL